MESDRIYLIGIGGIAMGNLAGALQEMGYRVSGSDSGIYPPMSNFLEARSISVKTPFIKTNIEEEAPGLVIIGNVVRAQNPEAQYVIKAGIPYMSMPEIIRKTLLKRKKNIVVSGTHGKSTTTALIAWVFQQAGYDPAAFVGALLNNWKCGYRIGHGEIAVIEGDEYDTAFFDKTPKFLHYNPFAVIVTGIEFDHGDIYPDLDSIRMEFEKLVSLIPPDGLLVVNRDDPHCETLIKKCKSKAITYGYSKSADWRIENFIPLRNGALCKFVGPQREVIEVRTSTMGKHNALNSLAVIALIYGLGLPLKSFIPHFETFPGLWRRQSFVFSSEDITIIDDFAHHPTAVAHTIEAVKEHFPERKIVAVFEPRTNTSKRKFFQTPYSKVFSKADLVVLKAPPGFKNIPQNERLDLEKLSRDISKKGIPCYSFSSPEETLDFLVSYLQGSEVILFMSNGPMDNLPHKVANSVMKRRG